MDERSTPTLEELITQLNQMKVQPVPISLSDKQTFVIAAQMYQTIVNLGITTAAGINVINVLNRLCLSCLDLGYREKVGKFLAESIENYVNSQHKDKPNENA